MSDCRHAPTVELRLEGGATIDVHDHDEHQLVYVSSGVVQVRTASGSNVVCADRAAWLPAGTPHGHRVHGCSSFDTVGFATTDPLLAGDDPVVLAVSPLLRELLIACTDPAFGAAEGRRVRAVIRDQVRRMPQRPIALPSPRDGRLSAACALVAERLVHPVALADLARAVNVSDRTLSRLFRSELGMSYPQWRTNLRVLRATIDLAGGRSVSETGQRLRVGDDQRLHRHVPPHDRADARRLRRRSRQAKALARVTAGVIRSTP